LTIAIKNNNKLFIQLIILLSIISLIFCFGTLVYGFSQGGAVSELLMGRGLTDSNLVLERSGTTGNLDIGTELDSPVIPPVPPTSNPGIDTVFGLWIFLTLLIGAGIIITVLYMLNNDEIGLEVLVVLILMIVTEVVITGFLSSIW
jgi:hypothetical protein